MAKWKVVTGMVAGVAALVVVTFWLARPSVPFRFLEGAESDGESLDRYFSGGSGQILFLTTHYLVKGTVEEVVGNADTELDRGGWVKAVGPGPEVFWLPKWPSEGGVYISDVENGFVEVVVSNRASLFDRLRFFIGLRKPMW